MYVYLAYTYNQYEDQNIMCVLLLLQGLNRPFPTFIKLNPAIPDLSIPELQEHIQNEESSTHQMTKPGQNSFTSTCSNFHDAYQNTVANGKLQCGHCENCLLKSDCGKCKMFLDKKKFGGPGKKLYDEKMQKD